MLWITQTDQDDNPTIADLVSHANENLSLVQEVTSVGAKLIIRYSEMQSFLYATMERLSYLEKQLTAELYQLQCWTEMTKSENGRTQLRKLKTRSDGWLICLQITNLAVCIGEVLETLSLALPQPF
jgi:hypothetical protein